MVTIAIDPSGNFEEGKGHTGVAKVVDDDWGSVKTLSINAKDYDTRCQYWSAVRKVIMDMALTGITTQVVIESYVTRNVGFTIGKMPETAMLIGVLVYFCDMYKIPVYFQSPSQAKTRFKDDLLVKHIPNLERRATGYYYLRDKMINDHERDALRHLVFFKRYKEFKV